MRKPRYLEITFIDDPPNTVRKCDICGNPYSSGRKKAWWAGRSKRIYCHQCIFVYLETIRRVWGNEANYQATKRMKRYP